MTARNFTVLQEHYESLQPTAHLSKTDFQPLSDQEVASRPLSREEARNEFIAALAVMPEVIRCELIDAGDPIVHIYVASNDRATCYAIYDLEALISRRLASGYLNAVVLEESPCDTSDTAT